MRGFVRAAAWRWLALLLGLARVAATTAADGAPALGLPLECRPGSDCWVANYADVDPSAAARDFACGPRSYDGHTGTDFALRDFAAMQLGVTVLAAAAGIVRNVRDGMADAVVTGSAGLARLAGHDCGNGVLLQHPGGWETQYCHLRQGSVRVAPGQVVEQGAPLALVGLSGNTEFPHLHLSVRHAGAAVDPFTGQTLDRGCGAPGRALWREGLALAYAAVALYNAGFAAGPPDVEAIRRGVRSDGSFAASADALVFWVDMFGVQAGDRLHFRITGPEEATVLDARSVIERTQARRFEYRGVRRQGVRWATGRYDAELVHERAAGEERLSSRIRRSLRVE